MFCPNCGTKNSDSAVKCAQCGFDQKTKAGAPKFKGTMMLEGPNKDLESAQALAQPSAASPKPKPNLKGTMVGVAPPGLDEIRKQAAAQMAERSTAKKTPPAGALPSPASGSSAGAGPKPTATRPKPTATRPKPNLKGTMVGLAPPEIADLQKQAALASAAKKASARTAQKVVPAKAAASAMARGVVSPASTSSQGRDPKFKGTMVGIAPPEMADLRKQAELSRAASVTSKEAQMKGKPEREPVKKAIPSKLKGTMIGIAPPEMKEELDKARAELTAKKSSSNKAGPEQVAAPLAETPARIDAKNAASAANRPQVSSKLKGTMIGVAPAEVHAQLAAAKPLGQQSPNTPASPSGPELANKAAMTTPAAQKADPLGGTVLGTSPLKSPGGAVPPAPALSEKFSEDTPAANSQQDAAAQASSLPNDQERRAGGAQPMGALVAGATAPMDAISPIAGETAPMAAISSAEKLAFKAPPTGDDLMIETQTKSSLGIIVLVVLLLAILFIGGGIAYMTIGDDATPVEDDSSKLEEPAPTPEK